MKNPYTRNILLQIGLTVITIIVLLLNCRCNEICCSNLHLSSTWENIIIGLLSSLILLLLIEIFQMFSDKLLYGYLEGKYSRTIITDVIANSDIVNGEKRTEDLNDEQVKEFKARNLNPIPGSRYVEILGYRDIGKDWVIELKYLYHGIYKGTAQYHKYWGNYGDPAIVNFTLILNIPNSTTGSGNYKYMEIEDYGTYEFQVNENNKTEILVEYKNTIPSGLSEGYEKWQRQ